MSRIFAVILFVVATLPVSAASDAARRAAELEQAGDPAQAQQVLAEAAMSARADREDQLAYAEFLDRFGQADRLQAYERVLDNTPTSDADARKGLLRRLVLIALAEGNNEAADRLLKPYRGAGGEGLRRAEQILDAAPANEDRTTWARIPGPIF